MKIPLSARVFESENKSPAGNKPILLQTGEMLKPSAVQAVRG